MSRLALFVVLGMICSGSPDHSVAQELNSAGADNISILPAEMGQGVIIPQPAIPPNNSGYSFGGPVVVLPVPMPLPAGGTPGSNNTNGSLNTYGNPYGFQYPGSYLPRDTPLHRFNGYVVCDPPNPPNGATGGASSESTGTPVARRLVKITTTRSLAAPGYLQPCPIYTINGEIQKSNSYTTRTPR
ncbi:hypothetical protein SAMN05216387_102241 [Nitrosovibrio tenuis]|uniref:Uncharacterized protein n=1 Tax=Nitrosovibrio tenuis TaxID=1233 RepID=A0A1H7IN72_9PROT|nr:hypothetical protein SAMN05216387_102241 [Nitrosovibrio tenuis]